MHLHGVSKLLHKLLLLHTLSSIFSVNSEHSRLVDSPMDEARAICTNVATVHVVHKELQGASCE